MTTTKLTLVLIISFISLILIKSLVEKIMGWSEISWAQESMYVSIGVTWATWVDHVFGRYKL